MTKKPLNWNLRIRLNEDEEQILIQLSQIFHEKNRSRIVRKMIREAGGQGPDLLKDDLNSFREMARQLAFRGNNLNQIARALNAGRAVGCPWNPDLLQGLLDENQAIKTEVKAIVMRTKNRWVKWPDFTGHHG